MTSQHGVQKLRRRFSIVLGIAIALALSAEFVHCDDGSKSVEKTAVARTPFRTLFVTRSLTHEQLIPYLKTAKPEIVQVGNYGAMFHGYADNPKSKGTPMRLPVVGEQAALDFQKKLNGQIHDLGLKVVGHFRLVKVMGDWEAQTGFVEYYDKNWPEKLLGPKPHAKLSELLQRDVSGKPVQVSRYNNGQLTFCLSSPHARKMFKQMLKCAVDHGVDGVITTYNYRFECACPFCQDAFKSWLAKHQTSEQLQSKLGVTDLKTHVFESIPARIPGYPDQATATDLNWLAARWGAEHFKEMYDDIFIKYGRSLRKDLIVAQWNHLGHVGLNEERAFTPLDKWSQGEDYFWYSGGATFVGKNLNLGERKAGDAWLSCLYVRELSQHKPFVMGKYDSIRMAASMAEGFATGGLGMGRYMRFEDPVAFEILARYTNFMHKNRRLYDGAIPYSDVALVLPRQSVLARLPDSLVGFRELGQALVERQLLLDVVVDQNLTRDRLSQYPAVILPKTIVLSDQQLHVLSEYSSNGGLLLSRGETGSLSELGESRQTSGIKNSIKIENVKTSAAAAAIVAKLKSNRSTVITSPWTVRVAVYSQPNRLLLHLVNYDRDETPIKGVKGPALERPKAANNIAIDLRLPKGRTVKSIEIRSPDNKTSSLIQFTGQPGRVKFNVPSLLVYGVVVVRLEE
jgi:hypothetical protein